MFRKLIKADPPRKLEEGTTKQTSQDIEQCGFILDKDSLKKILKKILDRRNFLAEWIFVMLCMLAIDTDTAFLRIPEIDGKKKCVKINKKMRTEAIVKRSVADFFYIIYSLYPVLVKKKKTKALCLGLLVDIIAVLPIPQVLVCSCEDRFISIVNFFYAQLVIRAMRMFPLFRKRKLRNWAEQIIFAFLVFFYTFVETSGVIGSLWYFWAIKEETACWKKALNTSDLFYCGKNASVNYTLLNYSCPTNPENKDMYDFGIFTDALKSGIVKVNATNSWNKSVYCWRWGLQSISGFGQGLETSTKPGENIFVLSITLVGVLLLIVSIGLVEMVIQYQITKFNDMISKSQELERWQTFQKFSGRLQHQIKKVVQQKMHKTASVDVENLLNCDISEKLKGDVKRELCLPLLKNVKEFQELREEESREDKLAALCDCAKPVTFAARTHIVRKGDPVNEMIFVVQGEVWTYTTKIGTEATAEPDRSQEDYDFCGKELPALFLKSSSFDLPTSNRAIQALTKVEAFAFGVRDLVNVFHNPKTQPSGESQKSQKNSSQSSGCRNTFMDFICSRTKHTPNE